MTLYEKRGRRYYPVSEWEQLEALPEGFHLIHVQPGSRTVKRSIEPDCATVEAALMECQEAMIEALRKTSQFHIVTKKKLTKREREILKKAESDLGWGLEMWSGAAATDVIAAALDVVRRRLQNVTG